MRLRRGRDMRRLMLASMWLSQNAKPRVRRRVARMAKGEKVQKHLSVKAGSHDHVRTPVNREMKDYPLSIETTKRPMMPPRLEKMCIERPDLVTSKQSQDIVLMMHQR